MKIHCSPLTDDTLFDGQLLCRQFRQGYRFSIDAVLAAHFCAVQTDDHILDLGCGCGVIGLIIAFRHKNTGVHVTGLEIQSDLAMLTQDNILANNLDSCVSVIEGDLRRVGESISPESFDLVVCNPPYREPARGRVSAGDQRARARHEIDAGLDDIVQAAAFGVKNRGRVVMVYPAVRSMTLVAALKGKKLEPKRLQPVYSYPESRKASLVLVEAVKNGGEEVRILPPLYVYSEKDGPYSDAVQTFYNLR